MKITALCLAMLAILLAGRQPAWGQATCHTFATIQASDAWMRELQRQPLQQQLLAIRQRIQCDTALRRRSPIGDVIRMSDQLRLPADNAQRPQGVSLLYIIDEQYFYANDAATAARFERVLARRHVRIIRYFESSVSGTLFGSRGAEGTILLDSK